MACVIFMIINIYRLYYYYFDMHGVCDVHFLWKYGVWVLIPSRFEHFEFIDSISFQFQVLADVIWIILAFCSNTDPRNKKKCFFVDGEFS